MLAEDFSAHHQLQILFFFFISKMEGQFVFVLAPGFTGAEFPLSTLFPQEETVSATGWLRLQQLPPILYN